LITTPDDLLNQDPDRPGAFGDPEGSRAPIDHLLRDFVRFGGQSVYAELDSATHEILRSRVLVGGKGAGKSVYLRRLQALAAQHAQGGAIYSDAEPLYADHVQQDTPTTEAIERISVWYKERFLTEKWQWLWRRAIQRSLASHLLTQLRAYLTDETIDELEYDYDTLFERYRKPVSIYSQLRHILNAHSGPGGLNKYLELPAWDELEVTLTEALSECPPTCFYVDAIDDDFAHSPAFWLSCQRGLFYEVMRLLRDQAFGGRLHVFICIRDVVFSSILRSEHADRYRRSPHIRMLSWDDESLRYFLLAKINQLSPEYLMEPAKPGARDIKSWLGIDTVDNDRREEPCTESVEEYLLRHIRPLPRDLVSLGNSLCQAVRVAKERGVNTLSRAWLVDIVAGAAKEFGDLQLTICANRISADMLQPLGTRRGSVSAAAYAPAVNQQLREFLHDHVGRDRFDRAYCATVTEMAGRAFSSHTDVLSVLWQHGLIGYGNGDLRCQDVTFYRLNDRAEDLSLPLDRDFYVLHSCLIDSAGIEPIGPAVFPFRRRPPLVDEPAVS
jgi:hypothetical protein